MEELRWYGKTLSTEFTDIKIVVLSDLHYGNPYCSLKHFERTVDFIKNRDDVFCFLNGDLLESAIKTSLGDVYSQKESPKEQRKSVTEILSPIKDKILGMTTGNHEARLTNLTSEDPSELIADALKVPYRPEGMLFKLSFGKGNSSHDDKPFVFWSYITHGYGGARTKSAKAVKAERVGTWIPRCDFIAMSHDHVVNVAPDVDFVPDNRGYLGNDGFTTGKITAHRKMLVKTNAFLKWGGYAEMGGFPPSDLTTPLIQLLSPKSPLWETYPDKARQTVKVVA
jgi:hypothetical protein